MEKVETSKPRIRVGWEAVQRITYDTNNDGIVARLKQKGIPTVVIEDLGAGWERVDVLRPVKK